LGQKTLERQILVSVVRPSTLVGHREDIIRVSSMRFICGRVYPLAVEIFVAKVDFDQRREILG